MNLTENIRLFNMDNIEFMKGLPDKAYDLAIVDPPYGINAPNMGMGQNLNRDDGWNRGESTAVKVKKNTLSRRLNGGGGKLKNRVLNTMGCEWDMIKPTKEYFEELFRVSKNQIIWGGNYFDLPPTRCIICWDKVQPWENFSQWEMAWTSFDKPAAMFRLSNTGGANKDKKIHPTQKPVKLYKWLLSKFAVEGDKILDTHAGSLSIGIACEQMGFSLDAVELSEDYYNSSILRFNESIKQGKLDL